MGRKIYLTEEQFKNYLKYFISEGIEYSRNPNGGINFRVNSRTDDASNQQADTRVWGRASDILYGDGTAHGKTKHLSDTYMDANTRIMQRQSAIDFIRNGFKGEIAYDDGSFKQKILNKYAALKQESETPEEDLIV